MEKYIEIQYVQRAGVYLRNFKQTKPRHWAFSHSCETPSKGGKIRVRGSIYEPKDNEPFNVKCFHCGYSVKFTTMLKDISPSLYDESRMEGYRDKEPERALVVPKPILPIAEKIDPNLDGLIPVNKFSATSPVTRFLERRMIPKSKYELLYVAKNFYSWASKFKPDFKKLTDDSPRLVIPYFNEHNRIIGFTCRTFNPSINPRYIHLRIDKESDFVYGAERLDFRNHIYITEGNIDSLFLDNAVAVGGANYGTDFVRSIRDNSTIIPDSDWKRNKEVGEQVKKAIKNGHKVAFIPDMIKGKDINDIILNGTTIEELKAIIDKNTKQGLEAMLEFALLKKYKVDKYKSYSG